MRVGHEVPGVEDRVRKERKGWGSIARMILAIILLRYACWQGKQERHRKGTQATVPCLHCSRSQPLGVRHRVGAGRLLRGKPFLLLLGMAVELVLGRNRSTSARSCGSEDVYRFWWLPQGRTVG